MYGTIDAAVCALDSINHVTDEKTVQKIFDRVSLFLNPGAVFVFDVNSVYKHREVLGNNVFVFDRDEVYCVWQNSYQEENFQVQMDLDFLSTMRAPTPIPAPVRAFASELIQMSRFANSFRKVA